MRSFKTPTGMSQPVLDPGWSDIEWELNHLNHSCIINWVNHQTYEDVNDINVWFSTANSEIHRGYVLFPSLPVFFPSKATRPSQLCRVSTWTAQSQGEVGGWQDDRWLNTEHPPPNSLFFLRWYGMGQYDDGYWVIFTSRESKVRLWWNHLNRGRNHRKITTYLGFRYNFMPV